MRLTKTKKKAFCCVLADTCNASLAARTVEVNRSTPYKWRKQDHEFATAWDESLAIGLSVLSKASNAEPTNNSLNTPSFETKPFNWGF